MHRNSNISNFSSLLNLRPSIKEIHGNSKGLGPSELVQSVYLSPSIHVKGKGFNLKGLKEQSEKN